MSDEAAEILRVESGRPRFGLDMGAESMPAEGRDRRAGGRLREGLLHRPGAGRPAALPRQAEPDAARPAAGGAAAHGDPLFLADREVGTIGTSCLSPALGPIALAIVRREAADGDRLTVGDDGITAEVVELPFAYLTTSCRDWSLCFG